MLATVLFYTGHCFSQASKRHLNRALELSLGALARVLCFVSWENALCRKAFPIQLYILAPSPIHALSGSAPGSWLCYIVARSYSFGYNPLIP
jgi:hypothetical protein